MPNNTEPRVTRRSTRSRTQKSSKNLQARTTVDETPQSIGGALRLSLDGVQKNIDSSTHRRQRKVKSKKGKEVERLAETSNINGPQLPTPELSNTSLASEKTGMTYDENQGTLLEYLYNIVMEHERFLNSLPMTIEELDEMKSFYASLEEKVSIRDIENERLRNENALLHQEVQEMRDVFTRFLGDLQHYRRELEPGTLPPKFQRKHSLTKATLSEWVRSFSWTLDIDKAKQAYREKYPEEQLIVEVSSDFGSPVPGSSAAASRGSNESRNRKRKRQNAECATQSPSVPTAKREWVTLCHQGKHQSSTETDEAASTAKKLRVDNPSTVSLNDNSFDSASNTQRAGRLESRDVSHLDGDEHK